MKYLLLCISFCVLFIACKEDKPQAPLVKTDLEIAAENLDKDGTEASAALYILEIRKEITKEKDQSTVKGLYDLGLEISKKYKIQKEVISFLVPIVRNYPEHENAEENLVSLILGIIPNNEIAGNIMIAGYQNRYPDGEFKEIVKNVQSIKIDKPQIQLEAIGKSIFENPDHQGVNKVAARKYVDAAEAYAIAFPNNDDASDYLFKAGEIARSLANYNKAITIFDWIESRYKDSEDAPNALFLKGFILDTDFKNLEAAKIEYTRFIERYPNHDLANSAAFLVENLGKSDEQLKKEMDEKNGK